MFILHYLMDAPMLSVINVIMSDNFKTESIYITEVV